MGHVDEKSINGQLRERGGELRLLIVAFSHSIHTARWIGQLVDQGWDIHLFPSVDFGQTHPDLKNVTVHHSAFAKAGNAAVSSRGLPVRFRLVASGVRFFLRHTYHDYRVNQLVRLIGALKPDIIHSLEIQAAGYLTLEAKKRLNGAFPPWIVTNWGSDIFFFGKQPKHETRIKEVLEQCDYYSCECRRDAELGRAFGFQREILPIIPNAGGFPIDALDHLRETPVSGRRLIMLKGYQGWAGRALVGLKALEQASDLLRDYTVVIYSASSEVIAAAKRFTRTTGVKTTIVPENTPHKEILSLHGRARISLGLSVSDALSTSFLEAFVMGAFPIQSWTSGAGEWIEHGRTGMLVPADDPGPVEQAIRIAMTDNHLVDQAGEINDLLARDKLDHGKIKSVTVEMYRSVMISRTRGEAGLRGPSRIEP
jgi:hypothetical protein